jgi:hypothetical protein
MVDPQSKVKKMHRHTAELGTGSLEGPRQAWRPIPYQVSEGSTGPLPGEHPVANIRPPEPETVSKLIKFLKKPE